MNRKKPLKRTNFRRKPEKTKSRSKAWLFIKDLLGFSGVSRAAKKRARFGKQFGEKADWIRGLGCVACIVGEGTHVSSFPRCSEAAHVHSRGAGGDSAHLIPLCTAHHHEQHQLGIKTFSAKYGLDLEALAAFYQKLWQEEAA